MNKTTCGFLSQHVWELPSSQYMELASSPTIKEQLGKIIISLIEEDAINRFLVSMELGLPMDAAEVILGLRERYPITLECIIPYEEQHSTWTEEERNRYFRIIERSDAERLLGTQFSLDCYQRSMKYVAVNAQVILALWNGASSDVGDAVGFARQKGREVITLAPKDILPLPL